MVFKLPFTPLRRPWAVWLAVWLAVLGALAPTVSHAVVGAQGAAPPWVEVCTDAGMRRMDNNTGQGSAPSGVHCPFCLLATDRGAPAPQAWVHLFAVSGELEAPTVRQAFFFITPLAPTPPPRGPPVFSLLLNL